MAIRRSSKGSAFGCAEHSFSADSFYYDNSTGIVWEDALKGFEAIGAEESADIIRKSASAMGGSPSKDREKRWEQLERLVGEDSLSDPDTALYSSTEEMYKKVSTYIQENAKDFMFDGDVLMPVWT